MNEYISYVSLKEVQRGSSLKMKILSSFTQLHVTPNLHYLLYSVKQKKAF